MSFGRHHVSRDRRIPRGLAMLSAVVLTVIPMAAVPATADPAQPTPVNPGKVAAQRYLATHPGPKSSPSPSARALQRAVTSARTQVLIVHVDSASQLKSVSDYALRQHATLRHKFVALRALSVQVPAAQTKSTIAQLSALPGVTSVEVAVLRFADSAPDDPDYASDQATYLTAVNAPSAWDVQSGSAAVKIAIVDSGVDVSHPDLSGKIAGTYNAVDGTTDVTDAMGHGTFVAGVAAAATNNGVGVAGAGYNTSLLAIKAADDTGAFTVDSVAAGIIWAADNGANVINISLSGPTTSSIEQNAVAYAQSKGVLVVAAAGNDASTTPVYPAGDPGVIAVGATDAAGQRATFSNYGSWVTVGAPGVGIFSTTPPAGSSIFPAADYGSGDGTSFSSPLVAGEAALLKAQDPAASTADVRRALVASAHGYSGLGLGTGQVDFSAAFSHLSPNTAPTVGISGDSGIVSISATSTAPAVEFQIDGGAYSGPVLVSSGVATYSWTSWGVANGPHTVHAIDCTQYGECGTSSSAANMVLTNATPGVTSPAAGAAVSGGFTITASSPGGGLQFRIDNVRRGFDATSPYSLAYTGSALTEGTHTVQVLQCSSDETSCAGPASPAVSFTARSLHPTITALTPNPFSPNRDGLKDTARVTIHLPDSESVAVSVLNASAATVRGPLGLHTLTAGTHYWTWSGITNGGVRAANGTYTVQVSTSRTINGVTVWGLVTHSVRLDTVAPGFSALTGAGAGFYPYPDGYHDTFSPGVALSEAGVLTFTIRTSAGRTVRVLRLSKPKGRVSLTWNGRDSANHLVAAGTYRWSYSVVDAASNTRRTSTYSVTVSSRRLVAKSAVVTKKGSQYRFWGGDPTYCTGASLTDSDFYPNGIWLENVCDPGFDGPAVAAAYYDFTMPAAISYQTLTMQVYGNTISDPSEILAGFTRPNSPTVDIPAYVGVSPTSNTWYSLGHVAAGGHYNSARTTEIAVAVDDYYGAPSDFDIGYVRLTVRYTVLQ